ncbi:MAG: hypothetical protein HUU37_03135 [Bdellovibrionales bacterium]|nr:hypothetical protein [Bdellovibrionales bacterium]
MRHLLLLAALASLAAKAEWKATQGGELEVGASRWFKGAVGADPEQFRPTVGTRVTGTFRNSSGLRFRLNPLFRADPKSPSKREQWFADPQEAYLQWQGLPWTVQLGWNLHAWGDTDVFNPLDVVNQRNFWDPLRSEKLGSPTILVKHDFESFFVEGLYVPKQRRSMLPGEKSRWMPQNVYRSRSVGTGFGPGRIVLPSLIRYQYLDPVELDSALEHNFGVRFKFRLPGFDWTVAGFDGAAPTPMVNLRQITATATSLVPELTFVVDPDIWLQATWYRSRMAGTSFVWVLGDFLVKGATAVSKPKGERRDLPPRTWENVLGLERTLYLGDQSLTALFQATWVDRQDQLDTSSVSLGRMFDRAFMGGLRWAPTERLSVILSRLRDTRFKGDLTHAEASWKLADGWNLKLAGDALSGAAETPLGTYADNDRALASVTLKW